MEIRFYMDPDTGLPHVAGHGVTEQEAEEVLRSKGEDTKAAEGSRRKIGRTIEGRLLQVIYVPDNIGDGIFVITAYELRNKAQKAFRRRKKRKRP
ncbi:MAG: DUF4258 domain-containing protein [Gemmataceae bacterium]|nr:DUF4258 domain-containing protein [Gemmataceae bacterium]